MSDIPDFCADNPTPVYVRVADWIESRIKSGELKPGARLPPERELARECRWPFHCIAMEPTVASARWDDPLPAAFAADRTIAPADRVMPIG